MDSTTELLNANSGLPIIAKGNCGIPQYVDGEIHFHGSPELMAQYALHARDAGRHGYRWVLRNDAGAFSRDG
jgi:5-methyltetrahydrofolate--homocysteine methyltransferase